ncbi:MAG: efflux RND transporter permease subunit, partial [Sphaerochaetaceae bacterium]
MKFDFLSFVGNHSKSTLAFILIVTLFFGYHAAHLQLDADYEALMNESEAPSLYQGGDGVYIPSLQTSFVDEAIPETMQLETDMLGYHLVADTSGNLPEEAPPYSTTYLVLLESDRLFEADILTNISQIMGQLEETTYLGNMFSVLDFVTLEKKGTRLMSVPFSSQTGNAEWSEADAQLLQQRIEKDPIVKNYLVSEDLQGMLFSFDSLSLSPEQEAELSSLMDPLRDEGIHIYINGGSVITNRLMHYLSR